MLKTRASHGETERTYLQQGKPFAGTNLPEEELEICHHLRGLIDSGYSYLFMERYLTSMGYGLNYIRKAFKRLTGISPEQAVNFDYQYSPGSIPQFSLGWGYAKTGKDVYFIMPMADWYGLFVQKGDTTRELVSKHTVLSDAVEAAKKKVKRLERWDPPIKDVKKDRDVTQLYKQPQLFMQADDFSKRLGSIRSLDERRSMIDTAFMLGHIDQGRRDLLLNVFCQEPGTLEQDVMLERLKKAEEKAYAQDPSQSRKESPQEVLEKRYLKQRGIPADVLANINGIIAEKAAELTEFEIIFRDAKISTEQPSDLVSPLKPDDDDPLSAIYTVSVWVDIIDKTLPDNNIKPGMMVFLIKPDGDIEFKSVIVGVDKRKYGIDDDGLADYFRAERAATA